MLSSNAPKSGSATDVKKWVDNLLKMHKEAFNSKHGRSWSRKPQEGFYPPWIARWLTGVCLSTSRPS